MELIVKVGATLPYKTGRFVPHDEGDVILLSHLSDSLKERIENADPIILALVEER